MKALVVLILKLGLRMMGQDKMWEIISQRREFRHELAVMRFGEQKALRAKEDELTMAGLDREIIKKSYRNRLLKARQARKLERKQKPRRRKSK